MLKLTVFTAILAALCLTACNDTTSPRSSYNPSPGNDTNSGHMRANYDADLHTVFPPGVKRRPWRPVLPADCPFGYIIAYDANGELECVPQ